MIKSLTSVYDSPNVAYFCGNTYPWFYADSYDPDQFYSGNSPIMCLEKPAQCTTRNYYKDSATFTVDDKAVTAYSQYGYVTSAASSGQAENPLYAFTIADESSFYYIQTEDFALDNPSLPMCTILNRITFARVPSILAIAPIVDTDTVLVAQAKAFRKYLIDKCISEAYYDYTNSVRYFDSQSEVESYMKDRHYDDEGYGYGKVAFSVVLNSIDTTAVQWDYSVRTNYTSFFDQDDHTVACLYGGYKGCDFTYTIPSTKFNTEDLFKPQSSEFLYGYTYSGFATLQQTVDQFIFAVQAAHSARYSSINRSSATAEGISARAPLTASAPPEPTRRLDARAGSTATADTTTATSTTTTATTTTATANTTTTTTSSVYVTTTTPGESDSLQELLAGSVRIMASVGLMPTSAYETDDFQYIISSTLGIFYMLSFLYPVSRIIRALVLEKETRIKEGRCLI